MTPCGMTDMYRRLRGIYRLHHRRRQLVSRSQSWKPEKSQFTEFGKIMARKYYRTLDENTRKWGTRTRWRKQKMEQKLWQKLDISFSRTPCAYTIVGVGSCIYSTNETYTHIRYDSPWISDRTAKKVSTYTTQTNTRHKHPSPQRDSKPRSQKSSGRRPQSHRERLNWIYTFKEIRIWNT
jgi:hypothetical protein